MVLSYLQKMRILTEYDSGKSMKNIADEMKINIKTVNKWIKRFVETKTLVRKRGSGVHKRLELNLNLGIV